MTADAKDDTDCPRPDDGEFPSLDRYSVVITETEALIIYDETNEDAWIQSNRWLSLSRRE